MKKDRVKRKNRNPEEDPYEFMDDRFAFIAGYTSGGAPYGMTWEEMGIDPDLPFEEKCRRYLDDTDVKPTVPDKG